MNLKYTLFLFPLVLLSYVNGFSQFNGGESYTCHRITETILIDGKPDESWWVNAKWTPDFVDIEGNKKPTPYLQKKVKCFGIMNTSIFLQNWRNLIFGQLLNNEIL